MYPQILCHFTRFVIEARFQYDTMIQCIPISFQHLGWRVIVPHVQTADPALMLTSTRLSACAETGILE